MSHCPDDSERRSGCYSGFPTVLVVEPENGAREILIRALERQGYLVLGAADGGEALDVARVHSRHIHLLLTRESFDTRTMAATLKCFRPHMEVFFVTGSPNESKDLQSMLDATRQILAPPATGRIEIVSKMRDEETVPARKSVA